jgi:hypothetical protein
MLGGQRVLASDATAAQRLEAVKQTMLANRFSEQAVNRRLGDYAAEEGIAYVPAGQPSAPAGTGRVYGPITREQYETQQWRSGQAEYANMLATQAHYGNDIAVVNRWSGIRDALKGGAKTDVNPVIQAINQPGYSPRLYAGNMQAAAAVGQVMDLQEQVQQVLMVYIQVEPQELAQAAVVVDILLLVRQVLQLLAVLV